MHDDDRENALGAMTEVLRSTVSSYFPDVPQSSEFVCGKRDSTKPDEYNSD